MNPEFLIEVRIHYREIFAQATGQPGFHMFAEDVDKFFISVVPAEIEFKKEGKVVTVMILKQGAGNSPEKN